MTPAPQTKTSKRRLAVLVLVLVECVAVALWWWSLQDSRPATVAAPIQIARPPATAKTSAVNLQFLAPKPYDTYRPQGANPFKGPAIVIRRPLPPPPPPPPPIVQVPRPPKAKIEIIYRGLIAFPDGRQSALVEDRLKDSSQFLQVDDPIYNYTVSNFDGDTLMLRRADGSTVTLRIKVPTVIGEKDP